MSLEHDHHDHAGHGHGHGTSNFGKAFAIGMSLNMAFVIVQVVFGIRANSVALLADAAHNLRNFGTALLFRSGRNDDLNIRGAYLHMAADAAISLGVVLAGIGIVFTGWLWLDPAVSVIVGVVIVFGTWGLLRDSVRLALDAVPEGIEIDRVRSYLAGLPGVAELHDLHIWGMSTTENALTVHLVMPEGHPGDPFVANVCQHVRDSFRIGHTTIQVETDPAHPCELAPEHVV